MSDLATVLSALMFLVLAYLAGWVRGRAVGYRKVLEVPNEP